MITSAGKRKPASAEGNATPGRRRCRFIPPRSPTRPREPCVCAGSWQANPAAYTPDLAGALHTLSRVFGELGRTKEAEGAYDDVLGSFADPTARPVLRVERAVRQPDRPLAARFGDLAPSLDLAEDLPRRLLSRVHGGLRALRNEDLDPLDRLGRERFEAQPAWLQPADAQLSVVVEWLNTTSRAESKAFAEAHRELLGPSGRTALPDGAQRTGSEVRRHAV
jgi:hypothetical protein